MRIFIAIYVNIPFSIKINTLIASIITQSMSDIIVLDAFGNTLNSGDTVQRIKPLPVKGTKITLNKGTKVKNIRLTDDIDLIEANIPEVK